MVGEHSILQADIMMGHPSGLLHEQKALRHLAEVHCRLGLGQTLIIRGLDPREEVPPGEIREYQIDVLLVLHAVQQAVHMMAVMVMAVLVEELKSSDLIQRFIS